MSEQYKGNLVYDRDKKEFVIMNPNDIPEKKPKVQRCTCDSMDLFNCGCRCKYFQQEQEKK